MAARLKELERFERLVLLTLMRLVVRQSMDHERKSKQQCHRAREDDHRVPAQQIRDRRLVHLAAQVVQTRRQWARNLAGFCFSVSRVSAFWRLPFPTAVTFWTPNLPKNPLECDKGPNGGLSALEK